MLKFLFIQCGLFNVKVNKKHYLFSIFGKSHQHQHNNNNNNTFAEPKAAEAMVHLKHISCAQIVHRMRSGFIVSVAGSMPTSTAGSSRVEQ